ncbi:MAG: HTH domain-containing protein, partial [Oscillospiraceae bacterium]|nr:HTH domain-containing protein [Oscillospiraceae bacterium]
MSNSSVLQLLQSAGGAYVSGEAMSQRLGITRAAIWKQIKRLREKGYEIEAVTNLGYRLVAVPESLDWEQIRTALGSHPWQEQIHIFDSIDSTNNALKRAADDGAP